MSFPNPDNYARDCDCGTAGANTTPPPAQLVTAIDDRLLRPSPATSAALGNVAAGSGALQANTTGANNTATGVGALYSNTTGNNNTASGASALFSNTTGASNVALGYQAGDTISTGSSNICIGSGADVDSEARSNCIVIGDGAIATVNGQIAFASTLATKTTIGANGAATALTALPVGYIRIRIGTTNFQIPYYNE